MLPLGLQTVLISPSSVILGITQLVHPCLCAVSHWLLFHRCWSRLKEMSGSQRELVFSYMTLLSLSGTPCSVDTKYAFDDWMIDGHVMYQSTGKRIYFIFHQSSALTTYHLVTYSMTPQSTFVKNRKVLGILEEVGWITRSLPARSLWSHLGNGKYKTLTNLKVNIYIYTYNYVWR